MPTINDPRRLTDEQLHERSKVELITMLRHQQRLNAGKLAAIAEWYRRFNVAVRTKEVALTIKDRGA